MTDDDRRASAERILREPFFKDFVDRERQSAWARLVAATSHEALLEAQAGARAIDNLKRDLKSVAHPKRPKGE